MRSQDKDNLQFYVLNSPQCDGSTLDSIETGERLADANVTATRGQEVNTLFQQIKASFPQTAGVEKFQPLTNFGGDLSI